MIAQVYSEKQTRHRFAQLNLGLEYQLGLGGTIQYVNQNQELTTLNLDSQHSTRFVLGGLHFWGHADFLVAINLFNTKNRLHQQTINNYARVETVFRENL